MDSSRTLCDPLAHFDGATNADAHDSPCGGRRRGVVWVLRWCATFAVLFFSACTLMEFAYCLAAERTLVRAARAGALEATLPRATSRTVAETIERRLTAYRGIAAQMQLVFEQNDLPLGRRFGPQPGDRLSVSLMVPVRSVLPRWLQCVNFWRDAAYIRVRAERQMPGRVLDVG
jgi:hypothetical protein